MRNMTASLYLAAFVASIAGAQPLAKPLADFDRMVSELKAGSVVGEPVRAGSTTVVPFAAVEFDLGGAVGTIGAMGTKTVPLGVIIVEGDDVRVEMLPPREEKSSATIHQLIQGIIDKKVSFMVNGINLGNAPGNVSDLTSMMNSMMGQTTVMVNGLNLGNLSAPKKSTAAAESKK